MMTFVNNILHKFSALTKWQRDFLSALFPIILALPGRMNMRNMSRFSPFSERSFARHFEQSFPWQTFNHELITPVLGASLLLATDCTFITKSGSKTYGLDTFFNGTNGRVEQGLELSVIGVIDTQTKDTYTLSAEQTPPRDTIERRTAFYLRQLQQLDIPASVYRHRFVIWLPMAITPKKRISMGCVPWVCT